MIFTYEYSESLQDVLGGSQRPHPLNVHINMMMVYDCLRVDPLGWCSFISRPTENTSNSTKANLHCRPTLDLHKLTQLFCHLFDARVIFYSLDFLENMKGTSKLYFPLR